MYPNKAKISEQNLLNSQAMYSTELIIEDLFRYTEKRRIYFFLFFFFMLLIYTRIFTDVLYFGSLVSQDRIMVRLRYSVSPSVDSYSFTRTRLQVVTQSTHHLEGLIVPTGFEPAPFRNSDSN